MSAARNPQNRIFFFITIDGVKTNTNVWAHAADARTFYPQQQLATSTGSAADRLDARIQVVWPHDAEGRVRPVLEAKLVNVGADLFARCTQVSVPADWDGTVRLYRALNTGTEQAVAVSEKRVATRDGVAYPRWEFNNVDVGAATDASNKYYFRVVVDGVDTSSTVGSHGADAPTVGCK